MKTNVKNILATFTLISISFSFASGAEDVDKGSAVQLPDFQVAGTSTLPIPLKKSIPAISADAIGSTVVLKFTINEKGKPTSIGTQKPLHSIYYPRDRDLAVQLVGALKYWTFEPARDSNGQAKSMTVLMPIKVEERNGSAFALISLTPVSGS